MTIKLIYHASGGDISLNDAGIEQDDTWFTTVFIMLFTDRRAEVDDVLPDRFEGRKGWPGDSYFNYPIGSRLWLLSRSKIVPRVLFEAKDYAKEALAPLIELKMAKAVDVATRIYQKQWLRIDVIITAMNNKQLPFSFSVRWEEQASAI